MRIHHRFVILSILFFIPAVMHASVSISEIMYDLSGTDTDHEWVEIHNDGGDSVSISGWQFSDGSNHNLNEPPANGGVGSMTIPAGGYAILAANAPIFLSDHSGYSGTVVDTVMSLNNTGATVSIVKEGSPLNTASYTSSLGGAGDGNSLQLVNGSWVSGPPTPGAANAEGAAPAGDDGDDGTVIKDDTTPVASGTPHIDMTVSSIVVAGVALKAEAHVYDVSKDIGIVELAVGKFEWNFGDGASSKSYMQTPVTHIYRTPGQYVLKLSYSKDAYTTTPFLTKRMTINVTSPGMIISAVRADGSVEIANTATTEQDLTGWSLGSSSGGRFMFANDTIVLPAKKIILYADVLGFTTTTNQTLILYYPSGTMAFVRTPTLPSPQPKNIVAKVSVAPKPLTLQGVAPQILGASAVSAATVATPTAALVVDPVSEITPTYPTAHKPYILWAGFAVFVGGAVAAMIYARKKKTTSAEEDVIRAEDITIVE